ncbi:MAG: hydroxymethylbilane synthase, partial [Bdellovibrio sp.]
LYGRSLQWSKLSHQDSSVPEEKMPVLATYSLQLTGPSIQSLQGKEAFFWRSGSQFLAALQVDSSLLDKYHACGPGNTHAVISDVLKKKSRYETSRLSLFLDVEDWRKQCTQ